MTWQPLEDVITVDVTEDICIPVVPCFGRGKTARPLHEMKPPRQLQELIEKNVPKKKPFGRGRGKSLKYMASRPGKSQSDSDSISGTSTSASLLSGQNQQKWESNLSTAFDVFEGNKCLSNSQSKKHSNPIEWTDADFPSLDSVLSSPIKQKKKTVLETQTLALPRRESSTSMTTTVTVNGALCDNVNTVLIENMPRDIGAEDVRSLLDSYGQVLNLELDRGETSTNCRVKLDSQESCEWAVACLHDTDSLFPEEDKLLTCVQLG